MNLQDLVYLWPKAAYLLFILVLLVILFVTLFLYRKRQLETYAEPALLSKLMIPRIDFLFWIKAIAFGLTWILATLALMQPVSYGEYPEELRKKGSGSVRQLKPHDVILLIDASASMSVKDTREGISRFDKAKEIADQIISKLNGDNVALHTFTSEPIQISPLTLDYLFVRLVLQQIQINEGGAEGTDLQAALSGMRKLYFDRPDSTQKTLILISDGGDTRYETTTGPAQAQRLDAILASITDAKKENLIVYTIGVGSEHGATIPGITYEGKPVTSALDSTLLKALGIYFPAYEYEAMNIANAIIKEMNQKSEYVTEQTKTDNLIHTLYYQIPLGIAILLLAMALLLPDNFYKRTKTIMQ